MNENPLAISITITSDHQRAAAIELRLASFFSKLVRSATVEIRSFFPIVADAVVAVRGREGAVRTGAAAIEEPANRPTFIMLRRKELIGGD